MNITERCGFYAQETLTFHSKEIMSHQQTTAPSLAVIPYCSHPKHSPMRRADVVGRIGGATALTCGGSFSACLIPKALFADVSPSSS